MESIRKRAGRPSNKKLQINRIKLFLLFNLIFASLMAPFIIFWGPFESLKSIAVGSIATSRHPQVVKAFLSKNEIERIMSQGGAFEEGIGRNVGHQQLLNDPESGILVDDIQGHSFKGKVMIVTDPLRVKVGVTKEIGIAGERLSDLVAGNDAIAGINGGGFYDPDGKGNGSFPDGLTVQNGKIVHNNVGNKKVNVIGLDQKGQLVIGNMSARDIEEKNILEAVSFYPNLIINGEPQITGDGGWGIAPRTGIGQRADGSISGNIKRSTPR